MASSTSLQVAGLASNFDWKSFVDQIMEVERTPANRLEKEKSTNSSKLTQLASLGTKLSALQDSANVLKAGTLFGKRTAASTTTNSTWNASATSDTASGSYQIAVSQLATAAKLAGSTDIGTALNATDDDVSGLTIANLPIATAVTAGTFTVNGKQVSVALTDSLDDVFDAISDATGGDVTASYDHTTDKITLSSTSTIVLGASNDTSNFLRALKLNNSGMSTVESTAKLGTVKTSGALASANVATAFSGMTSGAGSFKVNGVTINYDVDDDSLSTILKRITDSSAGVSASYDAANDRVILANKNTGDLGVGVSDATGNLMAALGLTSGTTLTRGKNAEFTLNGGDTLVSASNTLDSSAHGIAGLSVTVKTEETQTVDVGVDTTAMRKKIDDFVEDFNAVQDLLESQTKITTDSKGKVSAALLSGNREIQEWGRSLRTLAFGQISGLSGAITRLNDLGLDFTSGTNKLEIEDETKLEAALKSSTADVAEFFTTSSTGFAAKFDAFLEKITGQNDEQQERLTKANTSIDEQIANIERHLDQQRAVMESAFIQMETAQSKLKQQQTAVDGMWASINASKG